MAHKLTIAAAGVVVLITALAWQRAPEGTAPAETTSSTAPPQIHRVTSGKNYRSVLDEIDTRIDGLQGRADKRADDWLTRMHLASTLLERASLTNRIEDFERVQAVLDEAFALAPDGSGPLLAAARFNVSVHRLSVAEQYLDKLDRRAIPKPDETLAARVLRAQIAMQRGEYEAAFTGLSEAAAKNPAFATADLALYHAKTGNREQADALLEASLAATTKADPRRRAWTSLQRGIIEMEHGAYLQALERFNEADAELAGWWLVQEHIAEVHDHLGQHGLAITIDEELVRVGGLPQHIDALALLYQHAGQPEKATPLIEQARALWEAQLERLPESAMGHGLEHYLMFGPVDRALELAKQNYAVRPGGEAQVALARAHLAAGQPGEALALVEKALATPYRTAGLHHAAAQAYEAMGKTAEAQAQRELSAAINPSFSGQEHSH